MRQRYSIQYDKLMENLFSRKDHPTADMLYFSLREQFPKISLATVYRNLGMLENSGKIRRLKSVDGADRFDADISNHDHFCCNTCGAFIDLPQELSLSNKEEIEKYLYAQVDFNTNTYYGKCNLCMKK